MPIVALSSIADSQKFLPLPDVALEAHALGNLKVEIRHRSICFPLFPELSQANRIPGATGKGEPRKRHARWSSVGSAAVRRSVVSP